MGLSGLLGALGREIRSRRYSQSFRAASEREPVLAEHRDLESVLAALAERTPATALSREALLGALAREHCREQGSWGATALLLAFAPLLHSLRGRIRGDALVSDELDQVVLAGFLEALCSVRGSSGRVAGRLKLDTERYVFRAIERETRRRARERALGDLESLDCATEGFRGEPRLAPLSLDPEDTIDITVRLERLAGEAVPEDKLEIVWRTLVGGQALQSVAASRRRPGETQLRACRRLQRERHRTLMQLRELHATVAGSARGTQSVRTRPPVRRRKAQGPEFLNGCPVAVASSGSVEDCQSLQVPPQNGLTESITALLLSTERKLSNVQFSLPKPQEAARRGAPARAACALARGPLRSLLRDSLSGAPRTRTLGLPSLRSRAQVLSPGSERSREPRGSMTRITLPSAEFLKLTDELPAISEVKAMTTNELVVRYREVFGEPCRSRNRHHLVRRIAWKIQEVASGGLSAAALARMAVVGKEAPQAWRRRLLGTLEVAIPPGKGVQPKRREPPAREVPVPASVPGKLRDPRIPPVGTVLRREYKRSVHEVRVLTEGFEYRGKEYASLSAIALEITGTPWSGFAFFRMNTRPERERVAAE